MPFLSLNQTQQRQRTEELQPRKIIDRPHPFLIHHWTRGAVPLPMPEPQHDSGTHKNVTIQTGKQHVGSIHVRNTSTDSRRQGRCYQAPKCCHAMRPSPVANETLSPTIYRFILRTSKKPTRKQKCLNFSTIYIQVGNYVVCWNRYPSNVVQCDCNSLAGILLTNEPANKRPTLKHNPPDDVTITVIGHKVM